MSDIADIIKSAGDTLGSIFRHLLPGALALLAFYTAKPLWFAAFDLKNTHHLIVLGILALAIGNAWFVVHRYFIQQFIDAIFWYCNAEGEPKRKDGGYHEGVSKHVNKFFSKENMPESLRKHIRFRTSSVILMYILAEVVFVLLIFALKQGSPLSDKKCLLVVGFVMLSVAAIWQNYLTRRLEAYSVTFGVSAKN